MAVLLRVPPGRVFLEVQVEHLRDAVLRLDVVAAVGLRAVVELDRRFPSSRAASRAGAQLLLQAVLRPGCRARRCGPSCCGSAIQCPRGLLSILVPPCRMLSGMGEQRDALPGGYSKLPSHGRTPFMRAEQNEFLTRTGPGTPMGELFRRYWLPALLAEELPEPDCPPVRVKLLSRAADRVPRHAGPPRADRRVLRAPRRLALVRAQRGRRAALPLPRLEVRRDRPVRRDPVRAATIRLCASA